jgi:hypothetical protein
MKKVKGEKVKEKGKRNDPEESRKEG